MRVGACEPKVWCASRICAVIEYATNAQTHIAPRLKKVVNGEDPGGVTEATGWKGGGGYRFYRLAPSLLDLMGLPQPDEMTGESLIQR